MKKECRILITTECNLSCSYCCNLIPAEQAKIKMSTLPQILEMGYEVIKITGGEPFLAVRRLRKIAFEFHKLNPRPLIYVYTNMSLGSIYKAAYAIAISGLIDGINISIHNVDNISIVKKAIKYMHGLVSIRLHIQDIRYDEIRKYLELELLEKVNVKTWTLNKCDVDEDRYII